MTWWGRIAGAIIGLIGFGLFGAVLGFFIGAMFDRAMKSPGLKKAAAGRRSGAFGHFAASRESVQSAFFHAIFSVMGHMAKTDGRVSAEEIRHAEYVMSQMSLTPEQREYAIRLFNQGKSPDFDLHATLNEFLWSCRRNKNLQRMFLTILTESAFADGKISELELNELLHVAQIMRFSQSDFNEVLESVRAAHAEYQSGARGRRQTPRPHELADDFKILGVSADADEAAVKTAYRRKISQYHPDKLVSKGLPDEMIDLATEKSKQIRAAYERIKAARKQGQPAR